MSDRIELPAHLRALLEVMSTDMGVPVESLLNQAVFTLARVNGYVVPSTLPDSERQIDSPSSDATPVHVSGALEEGRADLGDAPPAELPEETSQNTLIRRANQAVRIRAIREDVAHLTTPFSRRMEDAAEHSDGAEEDEWSNAEDDDDSDLWESSDSYAEEETEWGVESEPPMEDPDAMQGSSDEPAWVDTDEPFAPQLVVSAPADVEPPRSVGPLLGSERASEGDYDQLLADLEDLETASGTTFDAREDEPSVPVTTDGVESKSRLTLTVEGGETVEVGNTPFLIGRTSECDLQIASDRVSREHAVVESDGALGYRIVDRNSSNGLWLGRERVREHVLQDGDVVRVGDRRLRANITPPNSS